MKANQDFKSGFVTLLGRPNVGKSTLLNSLVNKKVSIVSKVPQTTRHIIRGILNLDDAQIVFVDSPGIHSFKDSLARHLNTMARKTLLDIELILYVVDVTRPLGLEEERIMDFLLRQKTKIIIALNKIDINTRFLSDYIGVWEDKLKKKKLKENPILYYIPISAKTGKNLDKLEKVIKEGLPLGPPFYERETVTDFPLKFRSADIIREKLFLALKEELPHSLAVEVLDIEDKSSFVHIQAYIYVNRVSQKKIIIGKGGKLIREVGKAARKELEEIFSKKIYLELWVKVVTDWQKRVRILQELGYEAA